MEIRPATTADLCQLLEIDGTIESSSYLHLDRSGEGMEITWKLQERPLRSKLLEPNRMSEDSQFTLKQIVSGMDEGIAISAEHDGQAIALLVAKPQPESKILKIIDLRVDWDIRREGLASAMVFQVIQQGREQNLRAIQVETRASNLPANQFFAKCGFELAGVDSHRHSNHDLVQEATTLFWYAALD